mgnify:FL=1
MIGVIYFTIIACVLSIVITILNNCLFKNNKEEEILKMLPGYNCGACGFGSCSGMMHALMKDKNAINKCRVCKNKKEIIKFLGDINEK